MAGAGSGGECQVERMTATSTTSPGPSDLSTDTEPDKETRTYPDQTGDVLLWSNKTIEVQLKQFKFHSLSQFRQSYLRINTRDVNRGQISCSRTPILKTIHIDPCQESTKGVKQFHSSFHNIQRKRLPAPSPCWKHLTGLSHLEIYWDNILNRHWTPLVTWNWDACLQRSSAAAVNKDPI